MWRLLTCAFFKSLSILILTLNTDLFESWNQKHTYISSSPESKAHWWAYRIGRPPSFVVRRLLYVCQPHSLNIFSSETTGPMKIKLYMKILWVGGTKVCSNGLDHLTKMATMPIYGKNLKKYSSMESKDRWPWNLVYCIGCASITKFVQMRTLCWPWSLMRLYGKKVK